MHIDANSQAGRNFIADHLSCAPSELTGEDIEIFMVDETLACTCCGDLFTSRFDFADLDRDNGVLICHPCENTEEADDLRAGEFDWREVA